MTTSKRALHVLALLVFGSVLSSTLLIPALRPFMALRAPGNESATHAFISLRLLGAVAVSPFVSRLSRLVGNTSRLVVVMALLDAALLAWLSVARELSVLLAVRTVQGALNLGVHNSGVFLVDAGHTASIGMSGAPLWTLGAIAGLITLSLLRFVIFGLPSMMDGWFQQNKSWIYTVALGGLIYGVFYLM